MHVSIKLPIKTYKSTWPHTLHVPEISKFQSAFLGHGLSAQPLQSYYSFLLAIHGRWVPNWTKMGLPSKGEYGIQELHRPVDTEPEVE